MLSFGILRNRDFRFLVWTRMFITMALQAQAVIVGWQVYSITRDPWMLGLTGLAEAVPALTCALFAGHVVDISKPHRVYFFAVLALMLNTVMLALAGGGHLGVGKDMIITALFAGVFISGLARAFTMPASSALIPMIVPRKELSGANAWMNSAFQTAAIAGPAIAGIIYAAYDATGAWLMPLALTVFAAIMSARLNPAVPPSAAREPAWKSITEGWRFIWHHKIILPVMALDMFAVLLGGAIAILPAYAEEVLHVGAQGLGLLRAAPAIGAVAVGLWLATRPMRHLSGKQLLWVFAGFGVCMLGFGLSKIFWLSFLFLAASGAFDGINMVVRGTLVQVLTPARMMGRVSSIKSMFVISSNEIGAFRAGATAAFMGLVPSVVFGGLATLAVTAAIAILSPALRKTYIDSHDDEH